MQNWQPRPEVFNYSVGQPVQQPVQQPMPSVGMPRRPGALGGGFRPQVGGMYRPSTMAQPFDRGYAGAGTSMGFGQHGGATQGIFSRAMRP